MQAAVARYLASVGGAIEQLAQLESQGGAGAGIERGPRSVGAMDAQAT